MRKLVRGASIIIVCITLISGCGKSNQVEYDTSSTLDKHLDSFVALETDIQEIVASNENEESSLISDNVYTQEEIDNANIFSEPEIDLEQYYEDSYSQEELNAEANNLDTEQNYTDSENVNKMISVLLENNSYSSVEILDQWRDNAINVYSYYVLFDNNDLYCISEDDNNEVHITKNDYQYYLEMNS